MNLYERGITREIVLRWWERVHGPLAVEARLEFLQHPELEQLMSADNAGVVLRAIRDHETLEAAIASSSTLEDTAARVVAQATRDPTLLRI